jgi:selenocysteine lyase/cysteine desulfurase
MSPRGTAFMTLSPALAERLVPGQAGWFAGDEPYSTYYGGPLRLADTARRFDTSPAWFCWVATTPALELINRIGVEAIHDHDVRLANLFRVGLGLEPSDSAIVSTELAGADEALARAGILTSSRAGRLRAAFHIYNTDADVDAALNALAADYRSEARSASKRG